MLNNFKLNNIPHALKELSVLKKQHKQKTMIFVLLEVYSGNLYNNEGDCLNSVTEVYFIDFLK